MKLKEMEPHYQGLFWCYIHKRFYRWNEFMKISRRIDRGERI